MEELKQNAASLLDQLSSVISTVDAGLYAQPIVLLSNATIGQHTRHIIEFFQCLQEQVGSKVVNYTLRKRDSLIEENKEAAIDAMNTLINNLSQLESSADLVLEIDEEQNVLIKTNVERELFYNFEHAIHHMAIIKIGLKVVAPHLKLSNSFGVAPSTLRKRPSKEWHV